MGQDKKIVCPACDAVELASLDRRGFIRSAAAAAAAVASGGVTLFATPKVSAAPAPHNVPETMTKALYETLTDTQKKEVCFDWNYESKDRGLLRTHVSNNWQITKPHVDSEFFTKKQRDIIHDIFKGLLDPEWYPKILTQLKDDTSGKQWGAEQSIAIFGKPGDGKFEFVMTGRHMTIRADGNSEDHVAWGGPIFHGHAAQGFNEKPDHPGNVFWHQALLANDVYKLLDKKQQDKALVSRLPAEAAVEFRESGAKYPGIPIKELAGDQKKGIEKVLTALLAPYRKEDKEEVQACLKKQGGLDACSLAFYQAGDLGDDSIWDNWRIEGPSFVWYFRGTPHVHIWINVADNAAVKLNAKG